MNKWDKSVQCEPYSNPFSMHFILIFPRHFTRLWTLKEYLTGQWTTFINEQCLLLMSFPCFISTWLCSTWRCSFIQWIMDKSEIWQWNETATRTELWTEARNDCTLCTYLLIYHYKVDEPCDFWLQYMKLTFTNDTPNCKSIIDNIW